ncbi:MAG: MBL fold metallo-hydrolase [Cyclobacteriaceae bacterium]|nr:MBL fold metallo-hydrolase [Cyclobacteriaceae bacterium]
MIYFLVFILFCFLFIVLTGYFLSGPKYSGPVTDHFDGKKFFTPGGRPAKGLSDVFEWMRKRKRTPWTEKKEIGAGNKPPERVGRGTRITFVNHSTFLIQTDGINILTDPVWSERVSPFSWAGPKRMRPPGIRIEDLPKIDVILLSHNHYDHLDIMTLKKLSNQHHPRIITALGVKAFLDQHNFKDVTDLDWWQEFSFTESIRIQAVPAQHFSSRGMFDRDATLWCGFVINRPGGNIYFVGDTGYNEFIFKEIGARCNPINIALIPIGAYKPEWFMSPIHCSPEEAVKIHQEIKSAQSIATHFGTFPLADDGDEEPVNALEVALRNNNIAKEDFTTMKEGEGRDF